jgi:protein O-mannosyl-transferase
VKLALALLAIVPYLPALGAGFVWDDRLQIVGRIQVETLSASLASLAHAEGVYHRPLVFLGFALEQALFGGSAFAFHLANVLLHALNTTLVFAAGRRTGAQPWMAFVGAAIFALHPVQSEAVAYISGRTDLLMTAAALLALLAAHPGDGPARAPWVDGLLAAMATAAAIASKETGYALALFLPWIAWRHRRGAAVRLAVAGPAVLVAIAAWILRPAAMPGGGGALEQLLPRVGATLLTYGRLLVWPAALQVDRLVPMATGTGALALGLLALLVTALVAYGLSRRAAVSDWVAWSAAFYLPAANAWAIYPDIAGRALFVPEHNLYAPLAGIGMLLALAAARLMERCPRLPARAWAAAAGVVALAWAGQTSARCLDWRDELTLFRAAAAAGSRSPRVWFNLGNGFMRAGRVAEAVPAYEQAIRLAPGDAEFWGNLGVARQKQGELEGAAEAYERSLRLEPTARVYANLASLEQLRGDVAAAQRAMRRAAEVQEAGRSPVRAQ